jgi:HD superfamily phosphohydrolase
LSSQKVFRDPIHGDIALPAELVRLCDTVEFQRLRGIKMLGTASLVYPGAVHTRFEHSLGTCYLTGRLLDLLQPSHLEPIQRLAILAAALVHDLTHIPFGHTLEDERRVFSRHDTPQRMRDFLPRGQIGKALSAAGLLAPVLEILTEGSAPRWHSEIYSGTVCADLLDYLARDAYYCGLPQRYDPRIFSAFRISARDEIYLDAHKGGLVRHDVLSEVVNLLRLRYFLSERVYFHHAKTASGAMISRAVEQAMGLGLKLREIEQWGDEMLLYLLLERYGQDGIVQKLLSALRAHRIYKRAYVLTRSIGEERRRELVEAYHVSGAQRRAAEEEIIRMTRLKPGDLILYCPALGMQLKEADVRVLVDAHSPCSLSSLALPELQVLRERHQDLWKLYVFLSPDRIDKIQAVSRACETYFGESNHLPALQGPQGFLGL